MLLHNFLLPRKQPLPFLIEQRPFALQRLSASLEIVERRRRFPLALRSRRLPGLDLLGDSLPSFVICGWVCDVAVDLVCVLVH